MSVTTQDIKKAQDKVGEAVLSTVRSADQPSSGEEPPSGFQGKGTADEPYDQGNQPEQATAPGTEPPSGQQGAGTVGQPYDQGNQPEQNKMMSIVDELSRTRTKDEIAQKRARKESLAKTPSHQTTASMSQSQSSQPTQPVQSAQPITIQVTEAEESRGRDQANSATTSSSADPAQLAPKKPRPQFERSVSPGQLADGSHVRCSGERGEAYSPPTGVSRLKNKILH